MPDNINVADLYSRLGAMENSSKERSEQTTKLFDLLRDVRDSMATKNDIEDITKVIHGDPNREGNAGKGLVHRVAELESDKRALRQAAGVAIGSPPIIVALIELARFIFWKH